MYKYLRKTIAVELLNLKLRLDETINSRRI